MVLFGGGWYNMGGARDPGQVDVEWRSSPRKTYKLRLNAGAMVNGNDDAYVYFGLKRDYQFGEGPWGFSLGLAGGYFDHGYGVNLGGPFQFRTSGEFYVELGQRSRLVLGLAHLSNAYIYDENPGTNSLILLYGFRPKRRADPES